MEEGNKYFAFISYKREDEEWAIWLQHELEYYHLPAALVGRREELDIPKEFRPVFRDIDELKAGKLSSQISKALRESKNLIVICSPKCAANPQWVNKEIHEFIKTGEYRQALDGKPIDITEHIFPFIVEGTPHSMDCNVECFPSALIDISRGNDLLGGNVCETGRDKAFVKVLAGMLPKVSFDDLWDRYGKDKAEQERKEREEKEKLKIVQNRFIAEKAEQLVIEGDSYLARRLLLEVVTPPLPYTMEVESAFRIVSMFQSAILRGHVGSVCSASFSPDGKRIVSASFDNSFRIWDSETGRQIVLVQMLDKPHGIIHSASFSPDGRHIVSASSDNVVRIWDAETGLQIGKTFGFYRI